MRKVILLCAVLCAVLACASTPTAYHTLAMEVGNPVVAMAVSQRIRSLGVGSITLPTLLDREGMVIRQDATTLAVSDTHLWGGQLEDEFLQALAQHLQARLPLTRVQTVPWDTSQTPQYQVVVKLTQFDGTPHGKAQLRGVWQLQAGQDSKILSTTTVALTQQTTTPDVAGLVTAQSVLVAQLADQIVRGLASR